MQRPPAYARPQILSNRSLNEWINRIEQKHRDFQKLGATPAAGDRIREWLETAFVDSTLGLEGGRFEEPEVPELLAAFRWLRDFAAGNGRAAPLTPELLLRIHGGPPE